jgi:hypothetical protein
MSTVQIEPVPLLLRWLRAIVESLLPRSLRDEYLVSFDQYKDRSMLYQIEHAAKLIGSAYWVLAVPALTACGPYMPLGEVGLIAYCFGTAAVTGGFPWWVLLPLGSMLCALTLRDIWWHPGRTRTRRQVPPVQEYYLQSSMDALCALIFLFLGQGLAWYFAWAVAVPNPVLFRAASICLPLLPALRLILRPMPDPKSPFEGQGMSAKEMYRGTCRLNVLWAFVFCATVTLGASDIPNYIPDYLRGFLPLQTLSIFFMVQRDGLERMNFLQKLFVSLEEQALAGYSRFLPRPLQPNQAFYRAAKVLKFFIFAGLALEVEATIRPWLLGSSSIEGFFVAGNIIGLTVCVLTWRYVWQANQVTAETVHEELRRLRAARSA